MSKHVENAKEHFARNKTVYIVGAVCLLTGAAVGIAYAKGDTVAKTKAIQVLTWKSKQTIEVYVEALGDPGNIIQDLTTGTIYASQGQAAKALGVNPARISEHLAGKLANVQGHELVKLGKAAVAE